jgi:hypothetical protein
VLFVESTQIIRSPIIDVLIRPALVKGYHKENGGMRAAPVGTHRRR